MTTTRRQWIQTVSSIALLTGVSRFSSADEVIRYVRFKKDKTTAYGKLNTGLIHELEGSIFENPKGTGRTHVLESVELLAPCEPTKVLAVGRNYTSHAGDDMPTKPELFFKSISSILEPGGTIVIPPGTNDCHYEGELVVVIGKKAKNVPAEKAKEYVFGVTCGNDVSARDWQTDDLQWWRAKASDTFSPFGPSIAVNVDYSNLMLTTRLNGEIKQQQSTKDLYYNVEKIVSFTSQFVTLEVGDIIYTGTPGVTGAMRNGDEVEVEIDTIGILKNKVRSA